MPFVWALIRGADTSAAAIFVVAATSDVVDGWLARRLATSSELGRWLDHIADILFLLGGYGALAAVGDVAIFVPIAIAGCFAFYIGDSLRIARGASLVGSRLGHLAGILNYGILGALVIDRAMDTVALPDRLRWVAIASIPVYSGAAVVARLMTPRTEGVGGDYDGAPRRT